MAEREGKYVPEGVHSVEEEIDLPENLVQDGIQKVETAFKANVKDHGQQLIQTPQNQKVSITLPADPQTISSWSKGSPVNALTWLGRFWLRMIKKAIKLGWKIMGGTNVQ